MEKIILCIFGVLSLALIIFGVIIGNHNLYVRIFERKAWKMWKKVCEALPHAEFIEFADYDTVDSWLTNYKFKVIVDDKPYQAIYWKAYNQVSVHDESSCVCNPFDTYHNKIAVDIIKDLIKKL